MKLLLVAAAVLLLAMEVRSCMTAGDCPVNNVCCKGQCQHGDFCCDLTNRACYTGTTCCAASSTQWGRCCENNEHCCINFGLNTSWCCPNGGACGNTWGECGWYPPSK